MGGDSRLKRLALGTSSIFLLIVGVLLDIPQMYLMAVVISLLPVVYWIIGRSLQTGLTCDRSLPETCSHGERVAVRLTVHNDGFLAKYYIRLSDRLPRWIRFDGFEAEGCPLVLRLPGGSSSTITYFIRPRRRGNHQIGPTRVVTSDLIGVSTFSQIIGSISSCLVYPEVHPVNVSLLGEGASQGWQDQENAASRGSGSDFQGVREYRLGDDLRRLNWKTTARSGHLAVTEYALGFARDITILLDVDSSSFRQTAGRIAAFDVAVELCASLAVSNLKLGSSVRLATTKTGEAQGTVYRNENSTTLLTLLALLEPAEEAPLSAAMADHAERFCGGDTMIIISGTSPNDQGVQAELTELRRRNSGIGRPVVFWIDVPAFENDYQQGFAIEPNELFPGQKLLDTENARNVFIGPNTSIRDMLSRSTL
jgi:uncharacterized protein (DUF58 family)